VNGTRGSDLHAVVGGWEGIHMNTIEASAAPEGGACAERRDFSSVDVVGGSQADAFGVA